MQPPEPTNQNTNVAPTPAQEPQTPPPSPAPAPTPPPMHDQAVTTPSKKPPIALLGGIAALVLIAIAVGAYFMFSGGVKLQTYTDEKFSLQYPAEYEKKDINDGIMFTEKGEEKTASTVFAYYYSFPEDLTDEQVSLVRETFKTELDKRINDITGTATVIEDVKATDVKFKGEDAVQITGRAVENGQNAGSLKLIAVVNKNMLYLIGVGAHASDPAVASATDTIINSFTVK
jgi:flagellar basal body-associated protein FliL